VQFEWRRYCRPFVQPLQTHHGQWDKREGVLLRLNEGERWGEIAPLDWFGSESLEQAIAFCRAVPTAISADILAQIPVSLPACRFGFESLFAPDSGSSKARFPAEKICGLLPTGGRALEAWRSLYAQGTRTFKWKIGVAPVAEELEILTALIQSLPSDVHLRLDANGGLTEDTARRWLRYCDSFGVEFLEQPLPPNQFDTMLRISQQYQTPIALDESVATIKQLQTCYQKGWRGIFVVKAAIAGSPAQLRSFCEQHPVDIVWSSVFETPIAQAYIQNDLIPAIPTIKDRAIGFGVNHWFSDGWERMSFEEIWQSL
jgi:o-succinylbenzoate synthase